MAVIFQVQVFWVVTPCSVVVGYQRFAGLRCLHLQGDGSSTDLCNLLYPSTTLHDVTIQKSSKILLGIREVPSSNLAPEAGHHN
jgi:hypothetical protein